MQFTNVQSYAVEVSEVELGEVPGHVSSHGSDEMQRPGSEPGTKLNLMYTVLAAHCSCCTLYSLHIVVAAHCTCYKL